MKNKILIGLLFSTAASFLFSCMNNKNETPAIDKEKIKSEIQAKENDFAALYNTRELKNIGYYADDAKVFAQNKSPLIGKDNIISYLKAGLDSSTSGNVITFTTNEVFVNNDGSQVLEIGYYKLVDSTNVPINTGNYMVYFEKRDGKYYSVREMSTSDMSE